MIKYRKYVTKQCKGCGIDLSIRIDSLDRHSGFCKSCSKKNNWKDETYREKTSKAHLGKTPGNKLPPGEASFNSLFYIYRKSAEYRGIPFNIPKDKFRELTKLDCFYCGCPPSKPFANGKNQKTPTPYLYNGIDRLDDAGAYETPNIVPCCTVCNYMKQGLGKDEFLAHIDKIYNFNHKSST